MSAQFSGLRIEPHGVNCEGERCSYYEKGVRKAVLYVVEDGLKLRHEPDLKVQVLKRTGFRDFEVENASE